MSKHSWVPSKMGDKYYVVSSTGYVIAQAGLPYNDKTKMENMMLCAAAPDLLAALEALLHEYELAHDDEDKRGDPDLDFNVWEEVVQARAAIAKARGQ